MKINLILLINIVLAITLFSAEIPSEEPSWVYLKRGENFKEKGNYSQAIVEARKAWIRYIEEQLEYYYNDIREIYTEKTDYELKKLVKVKEYELKQNDNYPQYHELMGDLYKLTDFLREAEKEYKKALSNKKYFDYRDEEIEIKYKLAEVYYLNKQYNLEDITYREITENYFLQREDEYWERIRYNIIKDETLEHVFRIYRLDGMIYMQALYKIGRRAAILQKKQESLYYLANAAIVWMTYYDKQIKKYQNDFQYAGPTDFINYITKNSLKEYKSDDYIIYEILFYIGYNFYVNNDFELMNHYFELAGLFSKGTEKEEEIIDRITFLQNNEGHRISYEEIFDY